MQAHAENGEGLAVLDPHGDLVDRILDIIPPERIKDVVLIDPSDTEYPVGFNAGRPRERRCSSVERRDDSRLRDHGDYLNRARNPQSGEVRGRGLHPHCFRVSGSEEGTRNRTGSIARD